MTSTIEINRLSDVIGAEIIGIDLNTLDDTTFDAIYDAYLEHQMLCIRNQKLDPDAMVEFSERFGVVLPHDNLKFTLNSHPKILVLSNDVDANAINGCHRCGRHLAYRSSVQETSRQLYDPAFAQKPVTGRTYRFRQHARCIRSALKRNQDEDCRFKGHHSISKLKNKRVEISGAREDAVEFYKRQEREIPDVEHPLVRVHPVTGRKSLLLFAAFHHRPERR